MQSIRFLVSCEVMVYGQIGDFLEHDYTISRNFYCGEEECVLDIIENDDGTFNILFMDETHCVLNSDQFIIESFPDDENDDEDDGYDDDGDYHFCVE